MEGTRKSSGRGTTRIALLMAFLAVSPLMGQKNIPWYIDRFGQADIENPKVQRARAVFQRVSAAADRRGSRYPSFAVLRDGEIPIAEALPDGGIVVNLRALEVCYYSEDLERGDGRLAFVLAHELAHLVISSLGAGFTSSEALSHLGAEREADRQGLLFMTMAGFDPDSLLGRQTLFQAWLEAGPPDWPDNAASRAEDFKKGIEILSSTLPTFQTALTLYYVGHYPEAIQLFGEFRQSFPSREVFHNLGVSYLQRALEVLALCDGNQVVRFSMPVQADPWTLAARTQFRGPSQECSQVPLFVQLADEAEGYLLEATRKDPNYLPARVHLATLKVYRLQLAQAWSKAQEALQLAPDDPHAVNIAAVSSFLFADEVSSSELRQKALQQLKKLHRDHPAFLPAIFNLARLESLSENPEAARRSWQAYIEDAPPGQMAQAAADELNLDLTNSSKPKPSGCRLPIPLGSADDTTLAKLSKMKLLHKSGSIEVRGSKERRVIRIGRSVEAVEVFTDLPASLPSLKHLPTIQGPNPSFSLYLERKGLALKVIGGQVQSCIFFRRPFASEGKTAESGGT